MAEQLVSCIITDQLNSGIRTGNGEAGQELVVIPIESSQTTRRLIPDERVMVAMTRTLQVRELVAVIQEIHPGHLSDPFVVVKVNDNGRPVDIPRSEETEEKAERVCAELNRREGIGERYGSYSFTIYQQDGRPVGTGVREPDLPDVTPPESNDSQAA